MCWGEGVKPRLFMGGAAAYCRAGEDLLHRPGSFSVHWVITTSKMPRILLPYNWPRAIFHVLVKTTGAGCVSPMATAGGDVEAGSSCPHLPPFLTADLETRQLWLWTPVPLAPSSPISFTLMLPWRSDIAGRLPCYPVRPHVCPGSGFMG